MIPTPVTLAYLQAWMKRHHISRTALAEALMISKGTVDNWFCGQPIGKNRQKYLHTLMETYDLNAAVTRKTSHQNAETGFIADISILAPQDRAYFEKAARRKNISPDDLAKKIIKDACKSLCQMNEEKNT